MYSSLISGGDLSIDEYSRHSYKTVTICNLIFFFNKTRCNLECQVVLNILRLGLYKIRSYK